jgi:hypothetical protein
MERKRWGRETEISKEMEGRKEGKKEKEKKKERKEEGERNDPNIVCTYE